MAGSLSDQVFSPAVAMAAMYNRVSKRLGIDRLEVGPEFLSPPTTC